MNPSDVVCPAGELTRGTLSLNRHDVRCRADGMIMAADKAPCIDSMCYIKCPIWKLAKETEWKNRRQWKPEMIHA